MEKDVNQEIGLLNQAVSEIKKLRRQNDLMRARLDMFDAMNAILHTRVAERGEGMSPDLCWEIERFIQSKNVESKISE